MFLNASVLLLLLLFTLSEYCTRRGITYSGIVFGVMSLIVFLFGITVSYFDGVDWPSYLDFYNNISAEMFSRFEPGFSLIFNFFHMFELSFYVAIFLYFLIASIMVFLCSTLGGVSVTGSFLLILLFFYFDLFADQIRQAASVVFLFGFLVTLRNKRLFIGFLCAVMAVMFHYSSLIFIIITLFIFYISVRSGFNLAHFLMLYFFSLFTLVFVYYNFDFVVSYFSFGLEFSGESRLSSNLAYELVNLNDESSFGFFAIFDLFLILLAPYFFIKIKLHDDSAWVFVFIGMFIYSVLHLMFYNMPFMQRVSMYFLLYHVLAILYVRDDLLYKIDLSFSKLFIVSASVFLCFFLFQRGMQSELRYNLRISPLFYETHR